jgi:hypothetical protein
MLNRLRFKRKPKTVEMKMVYKANMHKLEPEKEKKVKGKDTYRKKVIV